MRDKMAISAYILKIVEKDPFLRLQMRAQDTNFLHKQEPSGHPTSASSVAWIIVNQRSDILQHSQNRPTGDRWLKF